MGLLNVYKNGKLVGAIPAFRGETGPVGPKGQDGDAIHKYVEQIQGDGATLEWTITHNLGMLDVMIAIYNANTKEDILTDTYRIDENSIKVSFKDAPGADDIYRVIVIAATDDLVDGDIPTALPNPYRLIFTGEATGEYDGSQELTIQIPKGFSGNYNDLSNKPELFDGDYNSLSNKPELFSGSYDDLANKPQLFDGNYNNLTNKPTIPTKTSQLQNDSDFTTEQKITDKINIHNEDSNAHLGIFAPAYSYGSTDLTSGATLKTGTLYFVHEV